MEIPRERERDQQRDDQPTIAQPDLDAENAAQFDCVPSAIQRAFEKKV